MITLYQFAPDWGLPNTSSFCLKLETYLRMAQLPFELASNADLSQAPKGKLPYITDQGKTIADSNLIIEYLKATYGDPLDQHLNHRDRAIALAMQRLIEENLYWVAVYSRWQDPRNWQTVKAAYFSNLPPVLKTIVPRQVRQQMLQSLKGHGIGRHTPAEIYQIGSTDLTALSDFLADQPFLMGDRPTSVDAAAYGLLTNILWAPIESPLKERAEALSNLSAYCHRIKEQFYSQS
ncbi:glutathione S-transferase family protein [Pantanalinema rosaneae CENA516]|uniref:glutathione S-transferase family protein n=1 Tax=Pantanalinema rosaneae TaxID=1620701 RepID=UPI003D702348